jgi:hypothetical protein
MQPWKGTCPFAHQRNYFVFDVYITVYELYIISPVYWYTLHSAVSMIYNQRASCNFHLLLDLVACESSSPCFVVSAPSKSCRTPSPPRAGQGTCNKHTNISKPKMFSMHVWKANINYHKLILVCMCIYIYLVVGWHHVPLTWDPTTSGSTLVSGRLTRLVAKPFGGSFEVRSWAQVSQEVLYKYRCMNLYTPWWSLGGMWKLIKCIIYIYI